MIVIADTTPLNYLVLIQHEDLLPRLFGRVLRRIAPPMASISFLDYQRDKISLRDTLIANGFPSGKCLFG